MTVPPFAPDRRGDFELSLRRRRGSLEQIARTVPFDWLANTASQEAVSAVLSATMSVASKELIAKPKAVTYAVRQLEQLEPIREDRWTSSATDADRIPCFGWSIVFDLTCSSDLIGLLVQDTELDEYPTGLLTPPPAINWRLANDTLVATCWVTRVDASDVPTPPVELIQKARDHVVRWTAEANVAIDAWSREIGPFIEDLVNERHANALRASAAVAEINELLGAARTPDLEIQTPPREVDTSSSGLGPRTSDLPRLLTEFNVEDIVKTINRWASAIEDDQAAFQKLSEPEHSAVLVATLRGAFGRSAREVFSGKGKLDFAVTAQTFESDGLAIVYGGELKIWAGEQKFIDAVQQELDNCTANTSDGVLVILVRDRVSFSAAKATALQAMSDRYESIEPVAAQAAFRVPRPADQEHMVRLVVMFVDETRTEEHRARAGRSAPER